MTGAEALAREAIRDTLARYTYGGDRGDLAMLAGAFAPDGVLETALWTLATPAGIADGLRLRTSSRGEPVGGVARLFSHHYVTPPLIRFDGTDAADVRCYFTVYSNAGADHAGVYVDRFVRVGDDWRIARRQVRVDWQSPQSVFPPLGARS